MSPSISPTPEATALHVWQAAEKHVPIVVGTTGLNAQQETVLHEAGAVIPVLYSANMSIGVNLLAALVERAAAALRTGVRPGNLRNAPPAQGRCAVRHRADARTRGGKGQGGRA